MLAADNNCTAVEHNLL